MDTPKGMGEAGGTIISARMSGKDMLEVAVRLNAAGTASPLRNGDGFAFVGKDSSITGFRGDVCSGNVIRCRPVSGIMPGMTIYRNISTEFEKSLETRKSVRLIQVTVVMSISRGGDGEFTIDCSATSQDGREISYKFLCGSEMASNPGRMLETFHSQMEKTTGVYAFSLAGINHVPDTLPFVSPSFINGIRRTLAGMLDEIPEWQEGRQITVSTFRTACPVESTIVSAHPGRMTHTRFHIFQGQN